MAATDRPPGALGEVQPSYQPGVTLTDLEQQVHDRVEAGWDGSPVPGVSMDHLRQINRVRGAQ